MLSQPMGVARCGARRGRALAQRLPVVLAGRRHGNGRARGRLRSQQGRGEGRLARRRPWPPQSRVSGLLRRPLSADAAVQIALLNNPGLQAAYNRLGIAEAVAVKASRPPALSVAFSSVSTPVELDIERQIIGSLLSLLTMPARTRIAGEEFAQAELTAAEETLRVAAETRRAYLRAVAARGDRGRARRGQGERRSLGQARAATQADRRGEQARSGAAPGDRGRDGRRAGRRPGNRLTRRKSG